MEQLIIKSSAISISPQIMNLVAGIIRKKELNHLLLARLSFLPKKRIGQEFYKLLQGAAKSLIKNNEKMDNFYLSKVEVNQGPVRKSPNYRAKGRSDRKRKRYSLIKIELSKKKDNQKKINNKLTEV